MGDRKGATIVFAQDFRLLQCCQRGVPNQRRGADHASDRVWGRAPAQRANTGDVLLPVDGAVPLLMWACFVASWWSELESSTVAKGAKEARAIRYRTPRCQAVHWTPWQLPLLQLVMGRVTVTQLAETCPEGISKLPCQTYIRQQCHPPERQSVGSTY